MRHGRIAVVMPLAFSVVCFGQIKIPVRDISAHRSPIRVSGTISFTDDASDVTRYTYRLEGSISNRSHKGVVLTVIHFKVGGVSAPDFDNLYSDDLFFGPTTLQPKQSGAIHSFPIRLGQPTVNGEPVPENVGPNVVPWATAKVEFVQFADGSTRGDTDVGRRLILERINTINELNRLELVLKRQGTEMFIHELSISAADFQYLALGVLVRHCGNDAAPCLIHGLHSMLQTATERRAEMKNSWATIPVALVDGETPNH